MRLMVNNERTSGARTRRVWLAAAASMADFSATVLFVIVLVKAAAFVATSLSAAASAVAAFAMTTRC